MIMVNCDYLDGYNMSEQFCFEGSNRTKRGVEHVRVLVDREAVLKLATICAHTKSVGHAAWHYNNPDRPMPCAQCQGTEKGQ